MVGASVLYYELVSRILVWDPGRVAKERDTPSARNYTTDKLGNEIVQP